MSEHHREHLRETIATARCALEREIEDKKPTPGRKFSAEEIAAAVFHRRGFLEGLEFAYKIIQTEGVK